MHSSTRVACETPSERGGGRRERLARRVGATTGQAYDAPVLAMTNDTEGDARGLDGRRLRGPGAAERGRPGTRCGGQPGRRHRRGPGGAGRAAGGGPRPGRDGLARPRRSPRLVVQPRCRGAGGWLAPPRTGPRVRRDDPTVRRAASHDRGPGGGSPLSIALQERRASSDLSGEGGAPGG